VRTRHVGDGAAGAIEVTDLSGRFISRIDGRITAGILGAEFVIPMDLDPLCRALVVRVRLPLHDLAASCIVTIERPPEVSRLAWDRPGALEDDEVGFSAVVRDAVDGAPAQVVFFREGRDGVEVPIGDPVLSVVRGGGVEGRWAAKLPVGRGEGINAHFRVRLSTTAESAPSPPLAIERRARGRSPDLT
jgi:hypothetical protein